MASKRGAKAGAELRDNKIIVMTGLHLLQPGKRKTGGARRRDRRTLFPLAAIIADSADFELSVILDPDPTDKSP